MDYDKLIAPAAKAMRPSGIRKFFDLAAEMPECISLGVGEPDFKTPWAVREAGIESLEHGRTRYTSNAGLKELRAEISRYLERRMNLRYDPMRQILVTVGGSEAIDMCIRTLVQPGDEVIIPEPCFVCYEPITTLSGGVPVHVACRQEDEFRLRAEALKAAMAQREADFDAVLEEKRAAAAKEAEAFAQQQCDAETEAAARKRAQTEADCKAMLARTQQEIQQRRAAFDRRASELLDGYHSTEFLPEERAK